MKKYILAAVFSLALLASPVFTQAAGLTQDQINSIISLIQSFGADSTTIANVKDALYGDSSGGGDPQPWCHTFTKDLTVGSNNDDVSSLRTVLRKEGLLTQMADAPFDENLAADVVRFQAKYGIRQTGYVGPITRAKLNALYGCPPNFPPPLPQPPITVIYPTAGMTFTQGQPMTISWQSVGNANANYAVGSAGKEGDIGTFSASQSHCDAADKCYISWTPSFSTQSFAVGVYDTASGRSGVSGIFTIVAPNTITPSITVLSPNGGETLVAGQTYTGSFGWNGFVPKNIKATLINSVIGFSDLTDLGAISVAMAGDKSFSFTIPSFKQPSSDYKINVCEIDPTASASSNKSICDASDAPFSIVAAPNKLQLTIPNNGEKWQIGSVHTIQWIPYNPQNGVNVVPTVSAYLERQVNGSFVTVGKVQEDGKASIHWSGLIGDTPQQRKNADPGEYYIRIVNSQTGEWDRSDAPFTLVAQNTIKVDLKINGLDASSDAPFALPTGGGEVTLSWTSLNADSCKTYFYGLADDVTDLPSSGQKKVFLKQNPYTWVYGITLSCSASIGEASDIVFIAGANANSQITILSPNGGESINPSSAYPITWTSSENIPNVAIALYKNDAFYRWIAPNLTNNGSLSWVLPKTISDYDIGAGTIFKIYMIGYKSSGGTVEDKSDAPFSIVADTPVSTPITLSSITPSSGPVGTSVRLDGCGSDSTSGFTLVYSGPKSGTASIPVETLGAASGCGYMTFSVPTDFPAGTYTLSVKNNQTGAMSTNTKTFTVTAPAIAPVLSVTPKTLSAGTPLNISVNGIPNAVLKVFCRDPNNSVCDDAVTYGTNSLGQFFYTYKTTGWTIGSYTGWVTLNGVKSNVVTFTITAPVAGLSGGASQTASVFNAVSGFASGDSPASQAPATTFNYVWNRDLQIGSPYQGDVIALQQALTREGVYAGEITGGFYNQTYAAVKSFQQKYGIDTTGYVGLLTRSKLNTIFAQR